MTTGSAKLLLSGYYGFDNFGDEAILQVFVEQWRRRRPADLLTVLSATPGRTAATYRVESVPRMSHALVTRAIANTDVFVSGGGGLLQSSTSLRSLLYYTGLIHEAKSAGRRAAIFAQGIGPLGFTAKHVVRRACARVDLAIVRDAASAALLAELLPRVDVRQGADPVFLASVESGEAAERVLASEGISQSGMLVAAVVRPARMLDRIGAEIARVVDLFAMRFGAQVVFVPFQRPDDVEAAVSIIRRCRTSPLLLGGGYDLATMAALFRRCTAVVGMRLHSLVLAAVLGVPFLAVPYDPKIGALCESLHYPLPALASGTAQDAVEKLMSSREALAVQLREGARAQAALASQSFDWLAGFVEGASP
ncbi:MAG TPA: polysaccharide pyruvyl transferase CsaB [Candidatus Acidoferrales bacterium]|nr:polysaccharide pyruvyl transferase CsaB [Candidatus Acidoferrales bacterium]